MYILSGSDTILAAHLLPLLRDRDQVCAFDHTMGDIRDGAFLDRLLDEVKPRIFLNCGGMEDVDVCEFDRERAYDMNAFAAGALAGRCRERGITLVQMSTSYVFDGRKGAPYLEDDAPSPVQAFGDSKLLAEKLIRECGCDHLIVRVPDLFGGSGSFIHALHAAVKTGGPVKVLKNHVISPTYAHDAALAVIALVSAGARGTVHVANSGCVSTRDLVAEMMGHLRRMNGAPLPFEVAECTYDDYPAAADRPPFNVLDCARFVSIAKKPLRGWKEAFEEYISYHRGEFA